MGDHAGILCAVVFVLTGYMHCFLSQAIGSLLSTHKPRPDARTPAHPAFFTSLLTVDLTTDLTVQLTAYLPLLTAHLTTDLTAL